MRITELKNKIIIAELDPKANYICIVNPDLVRMSDFNNVQLPAGMTLPIIRVHDINRAIKFVKVPKQSK